MPTYVVSKNQVCQLKPLYFKRKRLTKSIILTDLPTLLTKKSTSIINLYPLAELNQRIFNSANGFVIFVVNILEDCKCANLPYNSGKQSFSIFRIIPY